MSDDVLKKQSITLCTGRGQGFSRAILASFEESFNSIIKIATDLDKFTQEELLKRELQLEANLQNEYLYGSEISLAEVFNKIESIDTQITNLKSQLKHCKNPLQRLNLEREMNRLMRERRNK